MSASVRSWSVIAAGALALAWQVATPSPVLASVDPDAPAPSTPKSVERQAPVDISAKLQAIVEKQDVPALAAVVVRGDGTILMQGAWGVRQAGSDPKVTIDDLYHLGSCTKAMTASLCAILVQEGVLRWDMTLEEAFPGAFAADPEPKPGETKKPANPAWKKVTLLQLLTHRSGIPTDLKKDGLWSRLWRFKGEPQEARQLLLEGVLAYEPSSPPGTKFEYANAGFAVAGHMAEVKTGVPWETLMQQKLFSPLGITSVGYGAPGRVPEKFDANQENMPPEDIDQPRGHRANGKPVPPGPGSDNPAAIAPAGTIHMTLADWSKFVALHLRAARNELRPDDPLTKESIDVLHHPIPTDAAKPDEGYACGWRITRRPWAAATPGGSTRVLTHSGSNTMWYCVVWMSPERDFAVLVACNRGGNNGAKATDAAAAMLIGEYSKLDKHDKH